MILKRLKTGMFGSNCFIFGDNGIGAIIDPGCGMEEILEAVSESGLKIAFIIITHCHIDHIITTDRIRYELGAKVLIHEKDAASLTNPLYNGSRMFGSGLTFKDADMLLKDGDVLDVGGLKVEIIHTPGHSPGGICIKVDNIVFTGDTLFRMSKGRTDFDNGNEDQLDRSIKEKLMVLNDDVIVYPGHGISTTIGFERKNNPWLI
jgi:hydroxyacylglutathione hydrolase